MFFTRLTRPFAIAIAAACAGGVAARQLWPRDAHAQSASSATTIVVPWEGLIFRTPDGRAIARLSRDDRGGLFELYGEREEGAARFSAGALGTSHPAAREPYSLDDADPWTATGSRGTPPAIGF